MLKKINKKKIQINLKLNHRKNLNRNLKQFYFKNSSKKKTIQIVFTVRN